MNDKIFPLGDNVLLEIIEQKMTAGGLHIPEKARGNQRDAVFGKVMAVGPGRTTEYGATIRPAVGIGDGVMIARGAGVALEHESVQLRVIRDCEILCRVEETRLVSL